jgi:MoaA/NifB/PqqE/SkfB family radical SAM enzyme
MVVTGLHILQTYQCNFECNHCFVYSCPNAKGVMKISDIRKILKEAKTTGNIKWIYFEGGEPFLYYQTMLWGISKAIEHGFKVGIVTNAYWATSVEDAKEWLTPISKLGISDLSLSDDIYHYSKEEENLAIHAFEAAKKLNIPVNMITIEEPIDRSQEIEWKGKPIMKGKVLFKGRAVDKLASNLTGKPWTEFDKCLDEDFCDQTRIHIDPFGYVHVCQGITIGNINHSSLKEILDNFKPEEHPICGPIIRGGPAQLAKDYNIELEQEFIDECHLCYLVRLKLRNIFPNILKPDQVYGIIS